LQAEPAALVALKAREYSVPLLRMPAEDLVKFVAEFQTKHAAAGRTALIAYLDPFSRVGDDATRAKAMRMLAVLLSPVQDVGLPDALRDAAVATSALPGLALPAVPKATLKADAGLEATSKDARGFTSFTLTKRVDDRSAGDLERDLLAVREVGLNGVPDRKGSAELIALAKRLKANGEPYPGAAVACEGRADLAGLPFRIGLDATLALDKAQAMNALSKQLRETVQRSVNNLNDPRPDTDRLHAMLTGDAARGRGFHLHGERTWATAEAVPCIQQMLQPENREVRRMSCELLRRRT